MSPAFNVVKGCYTLITLTWHKVIVDVLSSILLELANFGQHLILIFVNVKIIMADSAVTLAVCTCQLYYIL